jgi:hypothetical protein
MHWIGTDITYPADFKYKYLDFTRIADHIQAKTARLPIKAILDLQIPHHDR